MLQPSGYNLISISELKRIFIFTVHLMNILEYSFEPTNK